MVTEVVTIIIGERGARRTSRSIGRVGIASRTAAASVRLLTVALAAIGGAVAIRQLVELADTSTRLDNRVRSVVDTTEEFVAVQRELRNIANETRAPIEETTALFQRFRVATRDLGITHREVTDLVAGLNSAILISGANAAEARAGLIQLGQGLASGRLAGDELRSVLENIPALAQRLADELGVTVGRLRELGAEGRLTAANTVPALQRAVKGFREELGGDFAFTISSGFELLRNALVESVGAIQKVLQETEGLTVNFEELATSLRDGVVAAFALLLDGFAKTLRTGSAIGKLVNSLGLRFINLGNLLGVIQKAIALFFDVVIVAANSYTLAINGLIAGFQNLGGALGFVDDDIVAASNERAEESAVTLAKSLVGLGKTTVETFNEFKDLFNLTGDGGINTDALDTLADKTEELSTRVRQIDFTATEGDGLDNKPKVDPQFFRGLFTNVSSDLQTALNDGFKAAIQDGENFFDAVGAGLEAAANKALTGSIQTLTDDLFNSLNKVFDKVASSLDKTFGSAFGALGPVLSKALSGALQFVALQALSALFGGGGNDSTSSTGNIESAVTGVEQVRGIVAGPQEIAIANIGRNIAEANAPVLAELQVQTGVLRAILLASSATSVSGIGSTSDVDALAFGSPPLSAA